MKKTLLYFLALPFLLVIAGCPYESDYPIDDPSIKVDINYLGKWEDTEKKTVGMSGGDGTDVPVYVVTRKSDYIYGVSYKYSSYSEEDGYTESVDNYEAHISIVGGIQFLNVKKTSINDVSEENRTGKYMLYKLEISGSTMVLTELSSCINKKFSNSAQVKSFITQNLTNELLYTESITFFKQ